MRIYGEGIRWMLLFFVALHHFGNSGIYAGVIAVNCFLILSGMVNAISTSKPPSIRKTLSVLAFCADVVFRRWFPLCTYCGLMIVAYFCTGQKHRNQPLTFNFLTGNWDWSPLSTPEGFSLFIVSPSLWFITALFFYQLLTPFVSVFFFSLIGGSLRTMIRTANGGRTSGEFGSNLLLAILLGAIGVGLFYYCYVTALQPYFKPFGVWANIHTFFAGYAVGGILCCIENMIAVKRMNRECELQVLSEEDPSIKESIDEASQAGRSILKRTLKLLFEVSAVSWLVIYLFVFLYSPPPGTDPNNWYFRVVAWYRIIWCDYIFTLLLLHLLTPNTLLARVLDQRIIQRLKGVNGQSYLLIYLLHDYVALTFFNYGNVTFNDTFHFYILCNFILGEQCDYYLNPMITKAQTWVSRTIFKPYIVK